MKLIAALTVVAMATLAPYMVLAQAITQKTEQFAVKALKVYSCIAIVKYHSTRGLDDSLLCVNHSEDGLASQSCGTDHLKDLCGSIDMRMPHWVGRRKLPETAKNPIQYSQAAFRIALRELHAFAETLVSDHFGPDAQDKPDPDINDLYTIADALRNRLVDNGEMPTDGADSMVDRFPEIKTPDEDKIEHLFGRDAGPSYISFRRWLEGAAPAARVNR